MADDTKQGELTEEKALKLLTSTWRRTHEFRDHVRHYRRPHFYKLEEMDPELAEPLQHVKFQTDIPRRKHEELKARLCENHGVAHITPAVEGKHDKVVEDATSVTNSWWHISEERNGYWIQDALSDGQIVDGYSVLHWREWEEVWPEVPAHEYLDALPEDDEDDDDRERERKERTRKRFEEDEESGKFKETDRSLNERTKRARARVGLPYYIEVVDPVAFSFAHDALHNIGIAVTVKRMALPYYNDAIKDIGSIQQDSDKLRFYPANEAPRSDDPSQGDYNMVSVALLWTREEWYEFFSPADHIGDKEHADGGEWQLVKSGKHRWGRPPFEIVPANLFNAPDPLHKYMPALEGVFREKPNTDRWGAIMNGLAERHAIPDMWWERENRSDPELTEQGESLAMGTDSQAAGTAPSGYRLRQNNVQINPAAIEAWRAQMEAIEEASPSIGQAELSASTQPWTARLAQAQANIQPKKYIQAQAHAIRAMWRSILQHASEREETLWAYKRDEEGNEATQIVGLEPEDIVTLNVNVDIPASSSAEQVTLVQHGMQMLGDPNVPLTTRAFIEDFWKQPNATQKEQAWYSEMLFKEQVMPGVMGREMARYYGSRYVVGPNGVVSGMGGQEADPRKLMEDMGYRPQQQQPARPGGPGGSGSMGQMPNLQDNSPPPGVTQQPPMQAAP